MQFQIVFDRTGDVILFDSVNDEILEYYINCLNVQNHNSFELTYPDVASKIQSSIHSLHHSILQANEWTQTLLDCIIPTGSDLDYLDPDRLNDYHANWANSLVQPYDIDSKRQQHNFSGLVEQIHDQFPDDIRYPTLGTVLKNLNLLDSYEKINLDIHAIEQSFNVIRYNIRSQVPVEFKNPFKNQGLSNNHANIRLSFNHLGRTLYNKFINQGTKVEFRDENNYNELIGCVDLILQPSQSINMSEEYKTWCRSQQREPLGQWLNFGNICDLDQNIAKYRAIVYQNILKKNNFTIQLL
mgnify:CR=1 FL=1